MILIYYFYFSKNIQNSKLKYYIYPLIFNIITKKHSSIWVRPQQLLLQLFNVSNVSSVKSNSSTKLFSKSTSMLFIEIYTCSNVLIQTVKELSEQVIAFMFMNSFIKALNLLNALFAGKDLQKRAHWKFTKNLIPQSQNWITFERTL